MNEENNKMFYDASLKTLLEKRFAAFVSPLETFIYRQTTAGFLLLALTFLSIFIANTPWHHPLDTLSNTKIGFVFGDHGFALSIKDWVSQGLMALFFFLVGLELKKEILAGKISHIREINLIISAAFGGIVVPAALYLALNWQGEGHHGWGIPTATDTAFTIGILAMMASRVSVGMTVFLTALAIFDDIGAIFIISIFYPHNLHLEALIYATACLSLLVLSNRTGVRNGWIYAVLGTGLWYFMYVSGIHATCAGLIVALTIPARPTISQTSFVSNIQSLLIRFQQKETHDISMLGSSKQHSIVADIGDNVTAASTPLQRWEDKLAAPIAILIIPLFALLNAGFPISTQLLQQGATSPVTLGIIVGLVIGKPLGILAFSYIALKARIGRLPQGVGLNELVGISCLAGIGFTMSIFFTTLSFPVGSPLLDFAKLGTLIASLLSACVGVFWIYLFLRRK